MTKIHIDHEAAKDVCHARLAQGMHPSSSDRNIARALIDHTAPDLLEAVGVDREHSEYFDTAIRCSVCKETTDGPVGKVSRCYAYNGHSQGGQESIALAPTYDYTGPGLGTPELDAMLLVAGLSWIRQRCKQKSPCDVDDEMFTAFGNDIGWESRIVFGDTPGHALARAIAEVAA